jgi:hypothetical protein
MIPPPQDLKAEAARCRRLIREIEDPAVKGALAELADFYERQAAGEHPSFRPREPGDDPAAAGTEPEP